jgi:DNA-binding MarR family transcriptional regulator
MHSNVLINLLKAVYWFDDALQDNMVAQGFPRGTRAISFILLNIAHGEHRATNIAKNLGVSRQAVSHMLIELRDRGMLKMRVDPTDKRSQIVDFSPRFIKMGSACAEILSQVELKLSRRIGAKAFATMRRALCADWGPGPLIGELTRDQMEHGERLWKNEPVRTKRWLGVSSSRRRKMADDTRSALGKARKRRSITA